MIMGGGREVRENEHSECSQSVPARPSGKGSL